MFVGFGGNLALTTLGIIMSKNYIRQIRSIMWLEYRTAMQCKRSFSPIFYLLK